MAPLPEEAAPGSPPASAVVERCYHCGTRVPAESRHCPRCRRPQYRVCFCGHSIPTTAESCPYCGSDWRYAVRVRRKARRRRVDRSAAARAALAGAMGAVVLGLIARSVVTGLAQRTLGPEQGMPRDWWTRLGLALEALATLTGQVGRRALEVGGDLLPLLALLALGAGVGVLIYLVRSDTVVVRLPWIPRRSSHRRRRATPK